MVQLGSQMMTTTALSSALAGTFVLTVSTASQDICSLSPRSRLFACGFSSLQDHLTNWRAKCGSLARIHLCQKRMPKSKTASWPIGNSSRIVPFMIRSFKRIPLRHVGHLTAIEELLDSASSVGDTISKASRRGHVLSRTKLKREGELQQDKSSVRNKPRR